MKKKRIASETGNALARVVVNGVDARGAVLARIRSAIVDVRLAKYAFESVTTFAIKPFEGAGAKISLFFDFR